MEVPTSIEAERICKHLVCEQWFRGIIGILEQMNNWNTVKTSVVELDVKLKEHWDDRGDVRTMHRVSGHLVMKDGKVDVANVRREKIDERENPECRG